MILGIVCFVFFVLFACLFFAGIKKVDKRRNESYRLFLESQKKPFKKRNYEILDEDDGDYR